MFSLHLVLQLHCLFILEVNLRIVMNGTTEASIFHVDSYKKRHYFSLHSLLELQLLLMLHKSTFWEIVNDIITPKQLFWELELSF